mgnify:CR=1 FL=1
MKKLLPFRMSPSSWGKTGRELELAQADYELTGKELQEKITEVNNKYDKEEATKLMPSVALFTKIIFL